MEIGMDKIHACHLHIKIYMCIVEMVRSDVISISCSEHGTYINMIAIWCWELSNCNYGELWRLRYQKIPIIWQYYVHFFIFIFDVLVFVGGWYLLSSIQLQLASL